MNSIDNTLESNTEKRSRKQINKFAKDQTIFNFC